MKHFYTLLASAILAAPSLLAQEMQETEFSYAPAGAETQSIGWGRLVDNDVAIFLNDPAYVGYEVVGISVDVPVADGCEVSPIGRAWLTSELYVAPNTYENVPDIGDPEGVEGEIKNVGTSENPAYRLDITFPDPYVIPKEGVYVGYTLTVTKLKSWTKKYPVQIVPMVNPPAGSLYMHSSYTPGTTTPPIAQHKTWQDLASSNQAVSAMRVILRGHKLSHGGVIVPQTTVYAVEGSETDLNVVFYNYGTENVTSADYTLSIGDNTVNGKLTFDTPVGQQGFVDAVIPIRIPAERGEYTLTLTTDKINNTENGYSEKLKTSSLLSLAWVPKKRVLLEEYTGAWCGYCPEAYVIVKQLHDQRPDDFITITYHSGDQLTTLHAGDLPTPGAKAPAIVLDRAEIVGDFPNTGNVMDKYFYTLAPADINVNIYWTTSERKELRAESEVHFLDSADADRYRIGYCLVEDDMGNPDWTQRNFFWSAAEYTSEYYQGPYWDLFIGNEYEAKGIVYDDVAEVFPYIKGEPGSIGEDVAADEVVKHHAVLSLNDARCIYGANDGKNVIMDSNKLRVVAVLVDSKTGEVANVNTSPYAANAEIYDPSTSGIDNLPAEAASEVTSVEYYSLEGLRLSQLPENGVVIVKTRYADGSVKTAKIMQ